MEAKAEAAAAAAKAKALEEEWGAIKGDAGARDSNATGPARGTPTNASAAAATTAPPPLPSPPPLSSPPPLPPPPSEPEDAFTAAFRKAIEARANAEANGASAGEGDRVLEASPTPSLRAENSASRPAAAAASAVAPGGVKVGVIGGDAELPAGVGSESQRAQNIAIGAALLLSTAGVAAAVRFSRQRTGAQSSLELGASSFKRVAESQAKFHKLAQDADAESGAGGGNGGRGGGGKGTALFGDASDRSRRKNGASGGGGKAKKGGRRTTREEEEFYAM